MTEGPLRRLASIVAMDVERGQSRCGRNPCDIREFVDLVGIADDMTHRPRPTPSVRSLGPSAVVAGHKRDGDADSPGNIGKTRRYIEDFSAAVEKARNYNDLYEAMVALYPGRINRAVIWHSAKAFLA